MKSKNANTETLKFFGILAIGLVIVFGVFLLLQIPNGEDEEDQTQIRQFNSLQEIESFLKENSDGGYNRYGFAEKSFATGSVAPAQAGASEDTGRSSASDYSKTNVQIEGVDEPDIVKNDGKYIYTVVDSKKVVIVNAYPADDMKILSEIDFSTDDGYYYGNVHNIFINEDKLIVFTRGLETIETGVDCTDETYSLGIRCGGYSKQLTKINVYDVSDRENPELEDEFVVDGDYIDARMINGYVYVISNKYINSYNSVDLPVYSVNSVEKTIAPNDIYYFDYPDSGYTFTTITAVDLGKGKADSKVFLAGYSSTIFVSEDNIYLSYQKSISYKDVYGKMVDKVILPLLPESEKKKVKDIMESDKQIYEKMQEVQEVVEDYSSSLTGDAKEEFDKNLMEKMIDVQIEIQKETEKTIIHRIEINKLDISYEGVGEVPGTVLNQFSMDEHKGYLRVATTTGHVSRTGEATSLNHLYILDIDKMKLVGSVEDLASGEQIYSARFIGDRAYMVTFKKIDPLFVIDVKNPEKPEVLGYLKVSGYSDYLHPFNEEGTLIIGVGKETRGGDENFAWYQGVKVSLFDATDVNNPVELSKIEIGDRGTDSYALYDHKAFTFDRNRGLLVLPILLAEVDETQRNDNYFSDPDSAYGQAVWQGAYVMKLDKGKEEIEVVGKITHMDETDFGDDNQGWFGWRYYNDGKSVKRSLYMDNFLYTISNAMIKANDINSNYDEVNSVELPNEKVEPPIYYAESFAGVSTGVISPSSK